MTVRVPGERCPGNRVEAVTAQRVTPAEPPEREPRTGAGAVLDDGLARVLRARRIEAAPRQPAGTRLLVEPDHRVESTRGT
jgi:hypothetical protein